ncbi:MFS transporter [Streptomonospora wellingtoniae]|uniref:MFS transporter n=1 Tax=Streptomonospora wellingtoniae TaxID=3075544 RepID=A0ABU2KN08_9ACTN|nr:MFS transporter [Streptomonospora sp. DSM 45055]MDT0300649.1 MFS transporter [Streptomonospora sp. DSM 45055]
MSAAPAPVGAPGPGDLTGRGSGAAYGLLVALGVLDAAGYSVIAPVLPALAQRTGAGPAVMGLIVAAFPLGMVAGFALGGAAMRRSAPLRVVLAGLVLICAGCGGFLAAFEAPLLAAARLVMGVGSGCLWLGVTFAALSYWPGQSYVCMSRIFAAYSAGGLLGPLLGSVPGVRGPFAAYLAAALLMAVAVVLLRRRLPARGPGFTGDRTAMGSPGFWAACAGIAFAVMALGMLEGVLPLHFGTRLGQWQIGVFYAATSVVVAAAAALAARMRPRTALLASTVLVVAGLGGAGAAASVPVWAAALVVGGTGIGMANTGSIGVLLEAVPAPRIVTAMVLWSQLGIAGYLLAPLLGGPIAETAGYSGVAAVLAAAGLVVVLALLRRPRA